MNKNRTAHKSHKDSKRCESGKVRFKDHRQAVAALHSTQNHAVTQVEEFGSTRRREVRSYSCTICKGWHLTSKPLASDTYRLAA